MCVLESACVLENVYVLDSERLLGMTGVLAAGLQRQTREETAALWTQASGRDRVTRRLMLMHKSNNETTGTALNHYAGL